MGYAVFLESSTRFTAGIILIRIDFYFAVCVFFISKDFVSNLLYCRIIQFKINSIWFRLWDLSLIETFRRISCFVSFFVVNIIRKHDSWSSFKFVVSMLFVELEFQVLAVWANCGTQAKYKFHFSCINNDNVFFALSLLPAWQ